MVSHHKTDKPYMKPLVLILTLLFINTAYAQRIDFILDIDGVLVDRANKETVAHLYPPEKIQLLRRQNRILDLNGHTYVLNQGAGEFIDYLASIPEAKITFFSTGPKDRNKLFLEHFKTSKGKTFMDIAEGRFLSYDAAVRISDTGEAFSSHDFENGKFKQPLQKNYASTIDKFIGPVKKDLELIEGLDLKRAILIDDRLVNATGGQEKNLLNVDLAFTRVPPTEALDYFDNLSQNRLFEEKGLGTKLYSWNNRLMLTAGIIDETLSFAKKNKTTIRDSLWQKQWVSSEGALEFKLASTKPERYFLKGQQRFQEMNKNFRPVSMGKPFCNYEQIFKLLN
jgi:hypothetical protein